MSTRSSLRRSLLGVAIVLATTAAGCGGSSSSGSSDVDPASVLPASAPVYFEATVKPEGNLKATVETLAKKVLRTDDPGKLITDALDSSGDNLKYRKDIEPWLGKKVGGAITSLSNLQHPDFAIAIATTDTDKAYSSIKRDTGKKTEKTYAGTKYLKDTTQDFAGGIVGDTLVIGTEAGFKAAVDAKGADKQLDDSDGLAKARKDINQDQAIGFVYADLGQALTAVSASQPLIASQIGPLKKLLGGATTISAAITVATDAINVDTVTYGGPAGAVKGDPAKTLADLPKGTVLGIGLGQVGAALKQGLDQIASVGPIAGQDPNTLLQGFETQLGLSIDKDLLSWMGEGAIFASGASIADLGGGLVVHSTDAAKTKATLAKLGPILKNFGVPVVNRAPDGAEAGFRVPLGSIDLLIGLKGDRFVIGVNPNLVKATLAGSSGGRLGDQPAFTSAAAKLGNGLKPAFYLDVPTVVNFIALAAGSDKTFSKVRPYLDTFGAIVAGSRRDGEANRSRLVLTVK